jgi:enoyl-CoA hydratase/carnithine racemase
MTRRSGLWSPAGGPKLGAVTFIDLIVKDEGPITEITLNRPEKRNALSLALMGELTEALRAASGRVIVIGGAGPCFSAGHDLSELTGQDVVFYRRLFDACTVVMNTLQEVPQPVIAKVHGVATAAGCQLVAS